MKKTLEPIVWGPAAWSFLHTAAYNFPDVPSADHQAACLKFMEGLPYMLPCGDCGRHLKDYLQAKSDTVKLACKSGVALNALMVNIHNDVNRKMRKPVWTVEQSNLAYREKNVCVKDASGWPAANPLEENLEENQMTL